MHVSVADRLSCGASTIYANVETADRTILGYYLAPKLDQQVIDRTPFGLEQVKESRRVSLGYHERVQLGYRIAVPDSKCEGIGRRYTVAWNFTENAA